MRSAIWFVVLALVVPFVAGCSGGGSETDAAQDKSFQDSLAKAQVDTKGKVPPNRQGVGKLPPSVAAQMGKGPGTAPAGGTPPADAAPK